MKKTRELLGKLDLAQRLVKCKHWCWMPGTMTLCGLRVIEGGTDFLIGYRQGATKNGGGWYDGSSAPFFPDVTDSGTFGALYVLSRRAWGCDEYRRLTVETAGSGWCVILRNGRHRPPSRAQPSWVLDALVHPPYMNMAGPFRSSYPTEEEALVEAIEKAP